MIKKKKNQVMLSQAKNRPLTSVGILLPYTLHPYTLNPNTLTLLRPRSHPMSKLYESDASIRRRNVHMINDLVDESKTLLEGPRLDTYAPIHQKDQVQLTGKAT